MTAAPVRAACRSSTCKRLGVLLQRDDAGRAALEDAGLLAGDLGDVVAEILGMVHGDGRHDGRKRLLDDVGGVEASAEAHFEQQDMGRVLGEQQEGGRRGDLEDGDRRAGIRLLAAAERVDQRRLRHEASAAGRAEPDALVEPHQMGRGVDVDRKARRFQDRAHEGDGRALAVRARHMDDGRQAAVRLAQRAEEPLQPPERQVDELGVQREEPRQKRV